MIFQHVAYITNEVWSNRARMTRVVSYDIKIENRNLYLGTLWKLLTPLIQIGTFWLVFGLGIRGGAPVNDHSFLVWMLAGIIPWFFISRSISTGASSIRAKSSLIFKIKYPISTVPVGSVMISLYDHFIMLGIMIVIFLSHGIYPNLYWLNLLYYVFFAFAFLVSLSMVLSVVVMLAQDLGNLINSLLQMLFFLNPILWMDDALPVWIRRILSANPARYIVLGFRDSILHQVNFYVHTHRILFFWTMTVSLFVLGCYMQKKYASRFVDWM